MDSFNGDIIFTFTFAWRREKLPDEFNPTGVATCGFNAVRGVGTSLRTSIPRKEKTVNKID